VWVVRAPRIQHALREYREQPPALIFRRQVREPKKRQEVFDVTSIAYISEAVTEMIMLQQADRADFTRLRILPGDDQGAVGLALVSYVRQARTFARAYVTVPSAQRLVSSS